MWPFSLSPFCIRTNQTQRTRAHGTASRPWPPSCPSCLGSRRTGWSCTIRTGTPLLLTHRTRLRETSRLKCEDTQTYTPSFEYTHAHAEIKRHTEIENLWNAIRKWFSAKISHTHCSSSPPMCSVGSHTVFVYCCSGQTWIGDCSTLYFRNDYWKVRTGAWHIRDWWKFLNELQKKKNLWKAYFWEKKNVLILFWRKKKKISFNCLMILGGGRKRRIFLHRSVLFIARGRKCHKGFSHQ